MKSLIITALILSFSQVACASGFEAATGAAPIVEAVDTPEAIGVEMFELTTVETVKKDLQIIEDDAVLYYGDNIEEVIAKDLKITETALEPARPLLINREVEVKKATLLGSL
jgi:hypothetical protein